MNFEKYKDCKKTVGIGREKHLIQQITEFMKSSGKFSGFIFNDANYPNNPEIKASWVNPESGSYFNLTKTKEPQSWAKDSKYPDYVLHYDLGGFEYGNNVVDVLLK